MLLVTGGCGFIGSAFVLEWLARSGEPLVNLDLLTYAGHPANVKEAGRNPAYTFVHGDIADTTLVARLLAEHRPRAVVHFAAESHVDRSIDGPLAFVNTNVVGTVKLLEAVLAYWSALPTAEAEGFRFLNVSTDEVYGSLEPGEAAFTERHRYQPNNPYSASKAAEDHMVRAWHHTFGLPAITTHCSNNYGPRQFPEKLIPLTIDNALSRMAAARVRRRPAGARLAACRPTTARRCGRCWKGAGRAKPTTSAGARNARTLRWCRPSAPRWTNCAHGPATATPGRSRT